MKMEGKAIGMIETLGLAALIETVDTMLKIANVDVVGLDEVGMALFSVYISGDITSVQIAIENGKRVAKRTDALISYQVIAHPDKSIHELYKE